MPKGLYKKIMYSLSHYAALEKLPIVEKKMRLIVPHSPLQLMLEPNINRSWMFYMILSVVI